MAAIISRALVIIEFRQTKDNRRRKEVIILLFNNLLQYSNTGLYFHIK